MTDPVSSAVVGGLGLGVSVIALASLFNSTLECLSLVDDARAIGKEGTSLAVQLQLEKVRFYQWGDSKHSLSPHSPVKCSHRPRH
jgi:hypothetical protein